MFLKFNVVENPADEPVPEICTFLGIRYDKESKLAIMSTEHDNHDYLMPVESVKAYTYLSDKLYGYLSKALITKGLMVVIGGSPVFRVKHGSVTKIEDTEKYRYDMTAIHGDSSFEIGKLFRR